jgi:ABC-2 type transport system ATP-binding protein
MLSRFHRIEVEGADPQLLTEIEALAGVTSVERDRTPVRIHVDKEGALSDVLRLLVDRGITSVKTAPPSLEEVYLGLIGDRGLEV